MLLNYLGGATSSLLSRIVGAWASESLRYLLLTLGSCGALYGWHKRSKGGEAAVVWAGAALFTVLMHRLLAASAAIFLNKGSEYISTADDTEILARWALTALFGCGGVFFLLGWALGNALYALPAALYAPGLCSIPIIIAAPSLAAVYPYYHQCVANHVVGIFSALMATTYLYTISATTTFSSSGARTHSSHGHKWRMQAQIMCLLLLFTSFRSISSCLHCGGTINTRNNNNSRTAESSPPRTGCTWRCPLQDGSLLSIIENSPEENPGLRYRAMRLNHAVMGGIWTLPKQEAGRPVYTAFHLQAAARLLLSERNEEKENSIDQKNSGIKEKNAKSIEKLQQRQGRRSLHIGLGAGTAVSVLQRRGFSTDVIEIYPEILDAAQTHFGLQIYMKNNGTTTGICNEAGIGIGMVGDALKVVPALKNSTYDLVILDVFSGGFPTSTDSSFFNSFFYPSKRRRRRSEQEEKESAGKLNSAAFFKEIRQKMKSGSSVGDSSSSSSSSAGNGVLAVNYVGMQDSPELAQLVCTLKRVFASVRCFKDAEGGGEGDDEVVDENEGKEEDRSTRGREKHAHKLGNFVIMATDNSDSDMNSDAGGRVAGRATADALFSSAQREISELGDDPLDEMDVDVLSRLPESELSVAWATSETCGVVLGNGDGQGRKVMKGAARRSHRALAGLHNAAAHWRTMRVQFGDEAWTL